MMREMSEMENLYGIFRKCTCVTTDSRRIAGGELFFALKGERFDGNRYALAALEAGAAFAVVQKGSGALAGCPADYAGRLIEVDDTLQALQALARRHREELAAADPSFKVVGLTGTNGKTTTKELIRTVLSVKYKVSATEGNLNNSIGVPLTLLGIPYGTSVAVVEMGASHPSDVEELVSVALPDLGLVTCVGKGHLLGFGDFEGVKKAKGEMYDFLAEHGRAAFVNADDADLMSMAASRPGMEVILYGSSVQQAEVLPVSAENPFLRMRLGSGACAVEVRTHLVGAYNAANVLAAVAVGEHFGIGAEQAAAAISGYVPSNNRSQMVRTERNMLIVDAYNANPLSMDVALESFAAVQAERKAVCLGNMLELGEESVEEHVRLVRKVLGMKPDAVLLVGEEFRKALDVLGGGAADTDFSSMKWFPTSEEAAGYLRDNPLDGAAVLVKGSRGSAMEKVIPQL